MNIRIHNMIVWLTVYSSGCIDSITKFSKTVATFRPYLQHSNHQPSINLSNIANKHSTD